MVNRGNAGALACSRQSPAPGSGSNSLSLSGLPSHSLASGGGSFLTVMFGQVLAYWALSSSHFSRPGSVSGLMASTGHSGSQTPQSMHSSGWMTSMLAPSSQQPTGQTATQSVYLHLMQFSVTT